MHRELYRTKLSVWQRVKGMTTRGQQVAGVKVLRLLIMICSYVFKHTWMHVAEK